MLFYFVLIAVVAAKESVLHTTDYDYCVNEWCSVGTPLCSLENVTMKCVNLPCITISNPEDDIHEKDDKVWILSFINETWSWLDFKNQFGIWSVFTCSKYNRDFCHENGHLSWTAFITFDAQQHNR